jgi:hypothetical protein
MSFTEFLGLLIPCIFIACGVAHSGDFPTDAGSVVLRGGFSYINASEGAGSQDTKSYNMSAIAGYFLIPDISLGAWLHFQKTSSGAKYSSEWGIGPQFTWFIGGKIHKPDLHGDILPYIGMGISRLDEVSRKYFCDLQGCRYAKVKETSLAMKFTFGISVMFTNTAGVYGEMERRLEGDENGLKGRAGLTFGLVAFVY